MRGVYKGFKQDAIAALGEFVGTTMFLFLGLGCVKTGQNATSISQAQTAVSLNNQTILFISIGMGLSLLVTAWAFFRITGGLFNPAVTLALWLIGGVTWLRAILLVIAQLAGGIAGAGLVAVLTPDGGVKNTITSLEAGVNLPQGLFIEAFLTAMLVFVILMLAAEKHRATYLAPVGIGLTLFVCQMLGTLWTGCGMNPARSLGPSVISGSFPKEHWIYWIGPLIGSLLSTFIYSLLKAFDYTSVVLGQDSDDAAKEPVPVVSRAWHAAMGYTRDQRKAMLATGMHPEELDRAEAGMVAQAKGDVRSSKKASNGHLTSPVDSRPSAETLVGGRVPSTGRTPAMQQINGNSPRRPSAGTRTDSSMHPSQQVTGGLGAPGSKASGMTNVPLIKKVLRH